ncbi:peptidase inhibitor family I36 [Frondihabitans sp. PhB188]|uniref:peptidase inhibitor family I36 protein n=1 Tax=Frondihabitans sp. PhB188 TaxID=2485200 RepID=UPI000F4A14FE|nr:peptidase inhibitor family I36 protein [Frondihabitans sp. PhB188]ROQ39688.1 peptidase inhibitor family I36 [Frondihabitans sp. PhB188]
MRVIRSITAVLASTGVIAGVGIAAAAPASAAPRACEKGVGCTYEDANYGWGYIHFSRNVKDYEPIGYWATSYHPKTNDAASSVYNNGNVKRAMWFKDSRYKGTKVTLARQTGIPNLGSVSLNDKVSSACFETYCY